MFSFPFFNALIIVAFIYVLVGKENIQSYLTNNYEKRDGILFRRTIVKSEGKSGTLFLPLNISQFPVITNRTHAVILTFLIVYALYKVAFFFSQFLPIELTYHNAAAFINCVDENTIMEIWCHFPEYSLEALCSRIIHDGQSASYVQYHDTRMLSNITTTVQFCTLILPAWMILLLLKKKWKLIMRSLFVLFLCVFILLELYVLEFYQHEEIIRQSAYYVAEELRFEGEPDFDVLQVVSSRVESEKLWNNGETGFGVSFFGVWLRVFKNDRAFIPFEIRPL